MTFNKTQKILWTSFSSLNGEQVAKLFTDFHGMDLLNEEFLEFCRDEGYIYDE